MYKKLGSNWFAQKHLTTTTTEYTSSMGLSWFVMGCPKRVPKHKQVANWKNKMHHETECNHVENFCATIWTVLYIVPLLPYQCTVDCGMWKRVECKVWGVKTVECWVGNVVCRVWSADCGVWSVKCKVQGVGWKVWSVESGMQIVKWKVYSVECEV